MLKNMEKRIELWVSPTGNVAVYRGNAFIPTEQLTEEERFFVLNRVCDELKGKIDLEAEIKKYTESLYNETFGNGQGTLDEFDWEDISTVIEDTAKHFSSFRPSWKPSEEQMEALNKAIPVCMGVAGRDEIIPLESLYEQLKKL